MLSRILRGLTGRLASACLADRLRVKFIARSSRAPLENRNFGEALNHNLCKITFPLPRSRAGLRKRGKGLRGTPRLFLSSYYAMPSSLY